MGAGVFILGTLTVTAIAMLIGIPIGLATAAFLTEMCPRRIATPLGDRHRPDRRRAQHRGRALGPLRPATHLLARRRALHAEDPGGQARLQGRAAGPSLFLAGFVLSIMIVPTMVALTRTALPAWATSTVRRPWRWERPPGR